MPMSKNEPKHGKMFSIGKVAAAAGVSVQTVRIWERLGHVEATRTDGKQRMFSEAALRKVVERAAANRRKRDQPRLQPTANAANAELASTGIRIKRARLEKGLSQAEAAAKAGVSRSFIAAVERGESGVSIQTLARLADAFSIPMSEFAGDVPVGRVMRSAERPRTVVAGGVTWEELASPGSHDLEPAMLHVPPGQTSGGLVLRPGDIFAFVMQGEMVFEFGDIRETTRLLKGDAVIAEGGTPVAWKNDGEAAAICLWVEMIAPLRKDKR